MKKIINKILDKIALAITKHAGTVLFTILLILFLSVIYLWIFITVRCFGGQRIYCHFAGSGVLLTIFICVWAKVRVERRKINAKR